MLLNGRRPAPLELVHRRVDGQAARNSNAKPVSPGLANDLRRKAGDGRPLQYLCHIRRRRRYNDARGRLAEKGCGVVDAFVAGDVDRVDRHLRPYPARTETALRQRYRKPAVGAIMGRTDESVARKTDQKILQRAFALEVERRRYPPDEIVDRFQVLAAAKLAASFTEQDDKVTGFLEAPLEDTIGVLQQPDDADDRGRVDWASICLVIQAD